MTLLDELRFIVGDAHVLIDAAERAGYETGARYGAGRAFAVVRPASRDEVQAVLRAAMRAGVHVVPQGANTGLVGASGPDDSGAQLVLSLTRLDRRIEIDAANRSVTVDAGVRLSRLNQALAEHGLCFPVDLGADPTIGGMIATNTGGARLLRYGDVRSRLLGLDVICAEGEFSDLRPLRKNNTGLAWRHLFVGTGGTFGVVTAASLQVAPLPLQSAAALVVPRDAAALLARLERSCGDFLTSFESLSRNALDCVARNVPSAPRPFDGGTPALAILVELASCLPAERLDLASLLQEELETLLADDVLDDARFGRPEEFWALRHAVSEALRHEGDVLAFDISLPRSGIDAFRAAATSLLAARYPEALLCDFGHRGDGGEHFNIVWPREAARPLAAVRQQLRAEIYAMLHDHGGSFSAEHGIGPHNQAFYDAYTPPPVRALARSLKAALDPHALLGRVEL